MTKLLIKIVSSYNYFDEVLYSNHLNRNRFSKSNFKMVDNDLQQNRNFINKVNVE